MNLATTRVPVDVAENPSTWGDLEHTIDQVLRDEADLRARFPEVCGLSLTRQIADAVRDNFDLTHKVV